MMGAYVELTSLLKPSILFLTGVILVVAVVSKVLSGWLGTLKKGFKTSFQTGVGMIPRGEVGIVVGGLGLSLGVIEPLIYTVVVSMSILTTLIAPPLIRWAYTFGKK
jgi:Kef-type K+ transport system membrane component KefB